MMTRSTFAISAVVLLAAGLSFSAGWKLKPDDNARPRYGEQLGLPANCHAYVDVSIAGYRSKRFTAEETMAGLERNCGAGGALWRR
jgi:hypothetical protein